MADNGVVQAFFVQCLGWFADAEFLYIAMEFLEYGDLQNHITKPFPEPEAALVTTHVAQALQFMHRRDIKPSNILVSHLGPKWHVKVADFGIAKNISATSLRTQNIGTPGYVAPELFSGSSYTTAVDIWALGAVVYCLRTGSPPPFRSVQHLLDYVRDYRRFPIGLLGESSGFCMNFVMSAMAEVPERRLTIEEVLAHDWISRQLGATQIDPPDTSLTNSTNTSSASPSNAWSNTNDSIVSQQLRPRSIVEPVTPVTEPELASLHSSFSLPLQIQAPREPLTKKMEKLAITDSHQDQYNRANRARGLRKKVPNDQRRKTMDKLANLAATYHEQRDFDAAEIIGMELFNLRGEIVGLRNALILASASSDQTVKLWEPETGLCISTLKGHNGIVGSVAWSLDAKRLASASDDKTVKIWDPATGECISTLEGHNGIVRSVAWSLETTPLASASEYREHHRKYYRNAYGVYEEDYEEDCEEDDDEDDDEDNDEDDDEDYGEDNWENSGTRLAASDDETVSIWDPATGRRLRTFEGRSSVDQSAFRPSNAKWDGPDDDFRVARSTSSKVERRAPPAPVPHIPVLPHIKSSINEQIVARFRSFKVERRPRPAPVPHVNNSIYSVAWSPNAMWLASSSGDWKVKIWDPATGRSISTLKGHNGIVRSVAWTLDATRLGSASDDKTVKIWDPATGECISTLEGHSNIICSVAWSLDGSRLASASDDKTIKIWDPATGQCISTLHYGTSAYSVAWSLNGSRLASAQDKSVNIWDPARGKCISTLEGHNDLVGSVAWSPDSTRLASASADSSVKIWDPATGRCISILKGHSDVIYSVVWSVDGSRLASASADGTVKIWLVATGRCISTLKGYNGIVNSVAWSRDDTRLASASEDGTIKIWDSVIGRCITTLRDHNGEVLSVAWSPNATRLASASEDKIIKLWDPLTGLAIWGA